MSKEEILFLVHRLPFPPNKGDKIRSYHLLRYLAERYSVHLGCFVDDDNDENYLGEIESLCASVKVRKLNPLVARVRGLKGLVSKQALSLPYYYDNVLANWIDDTLQKGQISSIITYSSPMGQYVMGPSYSNYRRIMDFVDVDSDKWRQYSEGGRWPMSWVYRREAKRLLDFERAIAREFDAVTLVTQNELDLLNNLAPETATKHFAVANGVATDFFDPAFDFQNPYPKDASPIVFTGMMDYWANVDAVSWFAKEIFAKIRSSMPSAEFWIVGASPTRDVLELESVGGVKVTGRVPDVRPYLKYAEIVVAPLRIARGIQNKVLEALAMGCPVLCTSNAAKGLKWSETMPVTQADTPSEIASAAVGMLRYGQRGEAHEAARKYTLDHYGWDHNLKQFERICKGDVATCR